MKKTIFSVMSAIVICCSNISNVDASDFDLSGFNEKYSKYYQLRVQYESKVEELCDSEQRLPEYQAACSMITKLDEEFSQYKLPFIRGLIHELIRASRNPLPKELEGVSELVSLIQSRGINIDEVRFMDALSLTNYLTNQATKNEIIPMLLTANKIACTNFIRTHLNNSAFSSDSFKSKVQRTVEQGCARSKLFRDLFVSVFGKISSGSSRVSAQLSILAEEGSSNHMSFEEGDWPCSRIESIILTCDRDNVFQNSFFNGSASKKKTETGTFAAKYDDISVLYHEFGHSSSAEFFTFTTGFDIDDTIKLIAALSNNLNFNEDALNAFFEHLKAAPSEMHVREECISRLGTIYDHGQNLDELKSEMIQLGASNEGIAWLLYLNPVEIFQIIGLALVKNGEKNILFINPLSDFALATELGLPIRADHSSFALNPEKKDYDFLLPKVPFVNHSLNLNLYGAMLKIYGSSMQKYVLSMMYGDGLAQALKAEWTLGKKYYPEISVQQAFTRPSTAITLHSYYSASTKNLSTENQ